MYRYLTAFLLDSGVQIESCDRYSSEINGAKITATRNWWDFWVKKKQTQKDLYTAFADGAAYWSVCVKVGRRACGGSAGVYRRAESCRQRRAQDGREWFQRDVLDTQAVRSALARPRRFHQPRWAAAHTQKPNQINR